MVPTIAIINTVIFTLLALLHLYWVVGGKWALEGAMPDDFVSTYYERRGAMAVATFVVFAGLLGFATTIFFNYSTGGLEIPASLIRKTTVVIGLIFLARAIGDLNYCGFFRQKTEGLFAERDKAIYTPLCLYLGLSTLLLAFN